MFKSIFYGGESFNKVNLPNFAKLRLVQRQSSSLRRPRVDEASAEAQAMQRQVVQQNQPLLKLRLTKLTFAKATLAVSRHRQIVNVTNLYIKTSCRKNYEKKLIYFSICFFSIPVN